jgi:hypothetical protein
MASYQMRPERDSLMRGHAALMVRAAVPAMNTAFKNALRFIGSYGREVITELRFRRRQVRTATAHCGVREPGESGRV